LALRVDEGLEERKTAGMRTRLPYMKTLTTPTQTLPFELGEPRSFAGLTILPLYPQSSSVEYIGLDEAVARGLEIHEVDEHGVVEALHVQNSLDELVLLYEGEELVGVGTAAAAWIRHAACGSSSREL